MYNLYIYVGEEYFLMKVTKLMISSVFILSLLVGCSNSTREVEDKSTEANSALDSSVENNAEKNQNNDELEDDTGVSYEGATIIEESLAFAVSYEDTEQLLTVSDIAVEGVVVATENYVYHMEEVGYGTPFTKVTLKVNKVIKGDESLVGKEILLLEDGGLITAREQGMADKFPDAAEEELDEVFFLIPDGHKPSIPGDEIVAFLSNNIDEEIQTGFDYYYFIGAYQSKFIYNEDTGNYERPSEDFEELIEEAETKEEISNIEEEMQIEREINIEVTELIEEME